MMVAGELLGLVELVAAGQFSEGREKRREGQVLSGGLVEDHNVVAAIFAHEREAAPEHEARIAGRARAVEQGDPAS